MADALESRGWLGVVHPLSDGVLISDTVIDLVLSGTALEAPKLRRAILGVDRLSDVHVQVLKLLDNSSILEGMHARFSALTATPATPTIITIVRFTLTTPAPTLMMVMVRRALLLAAEFGTDSAELSINGTRKG